MASHHPDIRPDEQYLLDMHSLAAPPNGASFHDKADLDAFLAVGSDNYVPHEDVIQKLSSLSMIASLMGPFGVGKNTAKIEAERLSRLPSFRQRGIPEVSPVINGTTRQPEFRDGRIEEHGIEYNFCHTKEESKRLRGLLDAGQLVQFAQPRGDHVYFSEVDSFPEQGIALMDTVPSSIHNINRVLSGRASFTAFGVYRTVRTFDEWMSRVKGRGDIFGEDGVTPRSQENYNKRMAEAAHSLAEAEATEGMIFFEAEEPIDAGKLVIAALTTGLSEEQLRSGRAGAKDMLRGLNIAGFKTA